MNKQQKESKNKKPGYHLYDTEKPMLYMVRVKMDRYTNIDYSSSSEKGTYSVSADNELCTFEHYDKLREKAEKFDKIVDMIDKFDEENDDDYNDFSSWIDEQRKIICEIKK